MHIKSHQNEVDQKAILFLPFGSSHEVTDRFDHKRSGVDFGVVVAELPSACLSEKCFPKLSVVVTHPAYLVDANGVQLRVQ